MENNLPPVETRFKDLTGNIAVNLRDSGMSFEQHIAEMAGYNPDRFEPVAIRFFMEEGIQLTIYALDRSKQETWNKTDKLPVHKFKIDADLTQLLPMIGQLNFTLTTGAYNVENMEVINK